MKDNNEIIEVVKLKIKDSLEQREIAEWIIENISIEFPTSDILERLIDAIKLIREHFPTNWKEECFKRLVVN